MNLTRPARPAPGCAVIRVPVLRRPWRVRGSVDARPPPRPRRTRPSRRVGSFSTRFTQLVGETPTAYRDRWAARGGPDRTTDWNAHRAPCDRGVDAWAGVRSSPRFQARGAAAILVQHWVLPAWWGLSVTQRSEGSRMSQMAQSGPDDHANEPTEITFDEHLHPARPRTLRFRPRVKAPFTRRSLAQDGRRSATIPPTCPGCCPSRCWPTPTKSASSSPGRVRCGRTRTPRPIARAAVETASVWFTAYPLSLITRSDESFLKAMADEQMWKAFAEIGIEAIHTGPVKRAGGISGLAADAQRRRSFRSDQHPDRPCVRHGGRIPRDVRDRQLVWRHHHRRHRPGPYRQGCRLSVGGDEVRRLPGHLPHGRNRSARLDAPARRAPRRRLGQHRRRTPRSGSTRPDTSSVDCSG